MRHWRQSCGENLSAIDDSVIYGGNYAFSVAFPANPQVDTPSYQIADNRSVPPRIYSVRQANVVFSMIVAELEGTNLEESAVVDHAIRMLSQSATVRLNIPARIYQVYGRQLTVEGADGSRSMVQLFDYKNRLYSSVGGIRCGAQAA